MSIATSQVMSGDTHPPISNIRMGAISAREAALTVCAYSGWEVTNSELQKLLYVINMIYLGNHDGRPLLFEKFKTHKTGPIIPRLYDFLSFFRDEPILYDVFPDVDTVDADTEEGKYIRQGCAILLNYSTEDLIKITHRKDGAMHHTVKEANGYGTYIKDRDIMDEFKKYHSRKK